MNYRQWKKNYKKKHGTNPPLEVDKRKQAKVMRRTLKQISYSNLTSIISGVFNGLAGVFKLISEGLLNVATQVQQVADSLGK